MSTASTPFSRKSDLPVKNSQTFSEPSPTFLRLPKLPPKLPQAFPSFPHHFPTFRGTFPSFPSVSAACQCLPRQSRAVRGNPSLAPPLPPSHNPPSSLLFLPTDPHTPMEPRSKPRDAHLSHPECERASASAPGWVSKEGPYGGASCGVGGCRCVWWWQAIGEGRVGCMGEGRPHYASAGRPAPAEVLAEGQRLDSGSGSIRQGPPWQLRPWPRPACPSWGATKEFHHCSKISHCSKCSQG